MPDVTVIEADGTTQTTITVNDNGRAAAASSKPVTLSDEDFAVLDQIETKLDTLITSNAAIETAVESTTPVPVKNSAVDYETVAASQTDQMMGATGAAGDYLERLLIIPATTSPGAVSIEDGSTNTTVFAGGASSVSTLHPFTIPLGINSASGGWEITTGANVSVIAFGDFT